NRFLEILFGYEWELYKSPAGAWQWRPKDGAAADLVPDAHDPSKRTHPTMLTTDLSLRFDPVYEPIARRYLENPDEFADAFARAWFKLTHRDMGPKSRYLGPEVPSETLVWQDPIPERTYELIDAGDIAALKARILDSGLSVSQLVFTAWSSAASYRGSDMRDLGGCAEVEKAAKDTGHEIEVPCTAGRTDTSQEETDVESFAVMEATSDGFRNYVGKGNPLPAEYSLIDRANLLTLTAPEMTVLIGGMRVLGANHGQSAGLGVFTDRPGTLTNDFFVNLLDMGTTWAPTTEEAEVFEGRDASGKVRWTGSRVDLVFGSNSELRALAEVYAGDDAQEKFVRDFVAAWDKV